MDKAQILLIAKKLQLEKADESHSAMFHGKSMLPFLHDGDELVIAPVNWDDIKKGDIITYRYEDKFPARRVVIRRGQQLVFWCEGWPKLRFEAARSDVIGQVVAFRRNGAWVRYGEWAWQWATFRALLIYALRKTAENYKAYGLIPTLRTIWQKTTGKVQHVGIMFQRKFRNQSP